MFKVVKKVLSRLSLEALLSFSLLGPNEDKKKKERKGRKVCGFGTCISTFYLWANSSQSLSPETPLPFEAGVVREEIFSLLSPGKQLAQK